MGEEFPTVQGRVPTPDCEGVQLAELAVVDTANAEEETRLGGNQLLDLLLKLVATSARQMKIRVSLYAKVLNSDLAS